MSVIVLSFILYSLQRAVTWFVAFGLQKTQTAWNRQHPEYRFVNIMDEGDHCNRSYFSLEYRTN